MELLFSFPTRRFHVREISRVLKLSPPTISKAINQLEKEPLVSVKKGFIFEIKAHISEKFIRLKRAHNLQTLDSSGLLEYLKETFPLSCIVLFGSYSKGEDTERSDIDIAIEANDKKLDLEQFEKRLNKRINIEFIDFSKINKELRDSIINGIVLNSYIKLR